MPTFVDRVVLHAAAGDGGRGCASVHREKFKPLGGPDGGNGGRGGDVVLVVDAGTTTLLDYRFHPHRRAGHGRPGRGSHCNGAEGADLVLPVPDGTVVSTPTGEQLADLVGVGTRWVVAAGGRGGLGNAALASPRRKAPGFALLGEPGQVRDVVLELKTLADVALIGFPSAGKSSLIAAMSAARPKVADYPFTTLVPHLGVVRVDDGAPFTVADVPGLIPGASSGRGLGLEFLRHVERCSVLVHVIDCATPEPGRDPLTDFDVIEAELAAYRTDLTARPRIVVLNKVDVPQARELADLVLPDLRAHGLQAFPVSAATHEGLRSLVFALAGMVEHARQTRPAPPAPRLLLRPRALNEPEFEVIRDAEGFVVTGDKPLRWVQQTDFGNDEAVGYLADRLARLGVEDTLVSLGAEPGAQVRIGDVTFDWDPATPAGAARVHGPRGSDVRLAPPPRRRQRSGTAEDRAASEEVAEDAGGADGAEGAGGEDRAEDAGGAPT